MMNQSYESMQEETLYVKAHMVIDFEFGIWPDMSKEEIVEDLLDRVQRGEYFPSDVKKVELLTISM